MNKTLPVCGGPLDGDRLPAYPEGASYGWRSWRGRWHGYAVRGGVWVYTGYLFVGGAP